MASQTLHRPNFSYSFPSPHNHPALQTPPKLFITPKNPPPQNPTKPLIPILTLISPQNTRNNNFKHFASSTFQNPHDSEDEEKKRNNFMEEEAREAVKEYLEHLGASLEDASHISFNCPNYLKTLIEGVNDLDDWNSWNSTQDFTGEQLGFKMKVYQMAERKGDNGVLPLLESIGLSLSSASHLARYLASSPSNTLPLLISKVKYVKEIFFSDSHDDHELVIGKNARRMMAHLSISADEDVQQTLAFFEKIEARRGGLNLLGSEQASFRYLIESFPRLLFMPLESRIKPIVKLLEDIGVPRGHIRNVLLLFPPILFYDIDKDIKPRLQLFEKVGAKDKDLGKMLVKYPWILSTSISENFEKVLHVFDEEKVPKMCSSRSIKNWPQILGCSVNKLKLVLEKLGETGIENKKLGKVLATSPQLLLRKPQEFSQVVSFFKNLGLHEEEIAQTLVRCPEIFAASIDKTLMKKLDFLTNLGISKSQLPRVIRKYPELFVCDVDRALLPRMRYLMKIGLSKRDIGFMVRRFSPLLGYSIEEVLRPKLEFLVYTMRKPVKDVVAYPRYFSYSLEKKIKPRYWVLKGRNIEFTLMDMLGKNDEEFADDYLGVDNEMLVPPS